MNACNTLKNWVWTEPWTQTKCIENFLSYQPTYCNMHIDFNVERAAELLGFGGTSDNIDV